MSFLLKMLVFLLSAADDMENGVLRGNRPAASNLWAVIGLPQFSGGQFPDKIEPRRNKVLDNPVHEKVPSWSILFCPGNTTT